MPRRYYRSRRTVTVRPKKKWATNISAQTFSINSSFPTPYITLVSNAVQSSSPTPTVVKCGNFKINADFQIHTSSSTNPTIISHLIAIVVFLPEGIQPGTNALLSQVIKAHPEYIMAWRQLDLSPYSSSSEFAVERVVFSSRLKRNLNSGDQIAFAVLDQTQNSLITTISCSLTAQYWTCSN